VNALPYSDSGSTLEATPENMAATACIKNYDEGPDDDYFDSWTLRLQESRGVWYGVGGGLGPCLNVSVSSFFYQVGAAIYEGECDLLSCVGTGEGGVVWNTSGTETSYSVLVIGHHDSAGDYNLTITVSMILWCIT